MLKKVFASFSCALLIFSASVLPCFADDKITGSDITVNTDGTLCTVEAWVTILGTVGDFPVPVNELLIMDTGYDATTVPFPVCPQFKSVSNFILTEDVTLYWRVAPFLYDELGVSNANIWMKDNIDTYLPKVYVGSGYNGVSNPDQPTTEVYVDALSLGNGNYGNVGCRAYRCTIPAIRSNGYFTEQFTIVYPDNEDGEPFGSRAHWNTQGAVGSLFLDIPLFTFVHTTDKAILNVLDRILAEAQEANVNLNNILSALDSIIVQLTDLGLTADEIASAVAAIDLHMDDVLDKLSRIEYSVQAIEYILTQALTEESESLNNNVQQATQLIDDVENADEYYYETTSGLFNQLQFDNGLGEVKISNALLVVGELFSGIWGLLDDTGFIILYTFPLILGISLLVVGRISRTRNSTKKDDD